MKARRCGLPSFSKSRNGEEEENSISIPFDVVIEILLRLPAKSTARFRCVSKLWGSTLRSPDFKESFFTISSSRPKLLFTCLKDGKMFFFTSHQPQDASSLTVSCHMSFPINYPTQIYRSIRGLICGLDQQIVKGRRARVSVPLICNPSTGQYLTLPKVVTKRKEVISYLGYVPIDKQFKVLSMSCPSTRPLYSEFLVLTLGTGMELSWRSIQCDIHHKSLNYYFPGKTPRRKYDGICINGFLYYLAYPREDCPFFDVICFEFRSEEFKRIRHDQAMRTHMSIEASTLVNYKGKLAMVQPSVVDNMYRTEIWVLEDAEKHEWSSYIHVLPYPQNKVYANIKIHYVGVTDTGEIVFSIISDSFYLLYYNTERENISRVEIRGMEGFKDHTAYTFLDHVEDVKPMDLYMVNV